MFIGMVFNKHQLIALLVWRGVGASKMSTNALFL
jgi:hypothetical protein